MGQQWFRGRASATVTSLLSLWKRKYTRHTTNDTLTHIQMWDVCNKLHQKYSGKRPLASQRSAVPAVPSGFLRSPSYLSVICFSSDDNKMSNMSCFQDDVWFLSLFSCSCSSASQSAREHQRRSSSSTETLSAGDTLKLSDEEAALFFST